LNFRFNWKIRFLEFSSISKLFFKVFGSKKSNFNQVSWYLIHKVAKTQAFSITDKNLIPAPVKVNNLHHFFPQMDSENYILTFCWMKKLNKRFLLNKKFLHLNKLEIMQRKFNLFTFGVSKIFFHQIVFKFDQTFAV
jgi:hypothetical protein